MSLLLIVALAGACIVLHTLYLKTRRENKKLQREVSFVDEGRDRWRTTADKYLQEVQALKEDKKKLSQDFVSVMEECRMATEEISRAGSVVKNLYALSLTGKAREHERFLTRLKQKQEGTPHLLGKPTLSHRV